ncbi:hypothetical protein [Pelobacter propionicus]|uniref:hypothetical protein n=1 Tax=Pelobacter propionicus TaxID=29543 RepID=UPI000307E090|nr:hypothetical protein [Pelobacter propionicus]
MYEREEDIPPELAQHLKTIDRMYPTMKINFVAVKGGLRPRADRAALPASGGSQELHVHRHPGDRFPHEIEALGGVRLIL